MAAQTGKHFQELLCEGRAQPVESTDPVAAKTIDDLKKQVSRQRAEVEAEKTKFRELRREHEREIRAIREQAEKKLEKSLDALSHRKDGEKVSEVAQVKERLLKQSQQELRTQRGDLEEEMRRLERRLTREREESMRKVLDVERKRTEEELSHYLPEDSVVTREEHLKAEIFRLGEEVERLEFQMSNLQRENREQINVIKKVSQEHKAEVENLKKKNQADAARDLAQLKLAEQIIQEKDRHIQEEVYRVDMAVMEREALAEELVNVKSRKTLEAVSGEEGTQSPTPSGKRVSMGGGGAVLQRRVEELEGTVRKLDEERRQLKQENASLRKAAVKEGGGEGDKSSEEKMKRLRKRNAELVALARQLDDKLKSLKMENEQLMVSGSVTTGVAGGGEKGKGGGGGGGGGESDLRKGSMSLSRQHARDISEYTKQILAKDRELETLRIRLAKYEVNGKARYEPAPEMEVRVRAMAMERLRMEKVMVQLYGKVSDPLDVGGVTKREMESESKEMQRVFDENKSLREELELLRSQARMEDVDQASPDSPSLVKQHSLPLVGGGGGKGGGERQKQLMEKNSQLEARVSELEKVEVEVGRLEAALKEAETAKRLYEQQNRRLTQQLKDAQQLAKEMDVVQETCVELEKEVAEVKGQLSDRDSRLFHLEKRYQSATESLNDARQEADSLRGKVTELEETLRGKQEEMKQLASELDQVQERAPPTTGQDVSLQTSFSTPSSPEKPDSGKITSAALPPSGEGCHTSATLGASGDKRVKDKASTTGERRVKSAKSRRIKSPVKRASVIGSEGVNEGDVSLDNEMRLAGFEITDPYDSSEGLGFSDTNLEGSSLLSLEEEMGRREAVGDRGAGGEGEAGMKPRGPADPAHQQLAWVEEEEEEEGEEERLVTGKEATADGLRTAVGGESESMSRDMAGGSRDIEQESHDNTGEKAGSVGGTTRGHESRGREEGEGGEEGGGDLGVSGGESVLEMIDLETFAEPDSSSVGELASSSNPHTEQNTDPPSQESASLTSDPTTTTTTAPSTVAVFIAKYSYIPAEMSPNPNYEQELAISAGDYLYAFGDMDADGFYFSQLVSGETGLVPSNFVEKVAEGEENSLIPRPPRFGVRARRVSELQDIPEMDEDASSSSTSAPNLAIPPPTNLELERQFVENDKYTVVIQWSAPPSLPNSPSPPSTHATTYHAYVNGQLKETVADEGGGGHRGVMSAHLRDIPRKQLVKISVRTVTDEGESPDPKKMIILNPQYPEAPTRVRVSLLEESPSSPANILVEWSPSHTLQTGAPISGYVVLINRHPLVTLNSISGSTTDVVCVRLTVVHLRTLSLQPEERLVLTVRAVSDQYQSLDSGPVVVPRDMFEKVMAGTNRSSTAAERVGLDSRPECTVESESRHMSQAGGYVTKVDNHMTTNGPRQVNGSVEHTDGHNSSQNDSTREDIDGVVRERLRGGPQYYTALFSYDPTFHSPNEEVADDELSFRDGDIIIACTEVDEEGFFEGVLRGKKGLVPSNMVELISEPEKLEKIQELLEEQQCRSPDSLSHHLPNENGGDSSTIASRKMRAIFKYNPESDSPNDNKDEELCIQEGDIITVFGQPDEDGYFQGELKGKRGLVPSNFLEVVKEGSEEEGGGKKVRKGSRASLGMEIFAASEEDIEQAKRIIAEASDSLKRSSSLSSSDSTKHKKGLFSMGKSLISKGVGKK